MTALATVATDRYELRCADPRHLSFGQVFASCDVRDSLDAFLSGGYPTCLTLVDTACLDGGHADAAV